MTSSDHRLQPSPSRQWQASTGVSLPLPVPPPVPPPPRLQEATASNAEHVFAITYPEATRGINEAFPSTSETPKMPVRSTQSFLSNFDPSINDINTWCEEVDRAMILNNWDDTECISRIRCCLKGDASTWLDQWNTYNLTWSNFKTEFNPLCPRKPDVADILFEVMSTNSDKFSSYADYARRSLLMLRTVRGLSDELISAIVVRGITDPHTRSLASNAKLPPGELAKFFSIHVKPDSNQSSHNKESNDALLKSNDIRKTPSLTKKRKVKLRCFNCDETDHLQNNCPKKHILKCLKCGSTDHIKDDCPMKIKSQQKQNKTNQNQDGTKNPDNKIIDGTKNTDDKIIEATIDPNDKIIQGKKMKIRKIKAEPVTCNFCQKIGHTEDNCFKKKGIVRMCNFCKMPGHSAHNCNLRKKKPPCSICNKYGHEATNCRNKDSNKTCDFCKKPGHTAATCIAKL